MKRQLLLFTVFAALAVPADLKTGPVKISLPAPKKDGTTSVEAALATRRSVRSYTKDALTLTEISQLLWAAQGVTGPDGKRTAPSAMRKYPLEVAVVVQNVTGLARGAYRYVPADHSLELLTENKDNTLLLAGATPQAQVKTAPAVFVIAAVYERMGKTARDRTFTDYEAGLASENLLLEAVAQGLGAVVTGGMDPTAAKDALKFTGNEQVIVVIPVGHPSK